MTHVTTHRHPHSHRHGPAPGYERAASAPGDAAERREVDHGFGAGTPLGRSLLAASAGARLLGVSLLIGALWAGVYWAAH